MESIHPFKLERYFAEYEFKAPFLLSASDCESLHLSEVLAMADLESAGLWDQLSLGYTESSGLPLLRAEIAGLYQQIDSNQILVLAPEEGIFIALHTLLRPGDEVVALSPAYQSLHEIARWSGSKVIPWPVTADANGWHLDLDQFASSLSPKTRLLVINFPHNPTGHLPNLQELNAILNLARKHGLYVFSDEMYRWLEYDPSRRLPSVCDLYERGISLSGMSKAFALPGLRIGWLACTDPDLMERWITFKDYTTICSSAPSEILALAALRSRQAILDRNLSIIQANINTAADFFSRYSRLFRWLAPQAGSVAFPEWLGPGTAMEFCRQALEQQGLMIVPGSLFDHPGNHFRLGLGRTNFPDAVKRLESILERTWMT